VDAHFVNESLYIIFIVVFSFRNLQQQVSFFRENGRKRIEKIFKKRRNYVDIRLYRRYYVIWYCLPHNEPRKLKCMSNIREIELEEKIVRTTYMAKPGEVERKWYVVDATDVPMGRLSAVVASVLRGKNKPTFTPHVDTGDFVIVINAEKIKLTGNKASDKIYYRHSNFPGGLKSVSAGELRAKNSRRLIETSVKGMLPKNTLGRKQGMKLHVYAGAEHPHAAQQPEVLDITNLI